MSDLYRPSAPWSGRDDGPGAEHRRWHQWVTTDPEGAAPNSIALAGFASDAGVRRNLGRPGAAEGPTALRAALASLPVHDADPITDLGDVVVHEDDLESGQAAFGELVARGLGDHGRVLVLGGGHETAWGTYLGRTGVGHLEGKRVGVVNLDAHFDLREADWPTSGTPFRQMARADAAAGREFCYMVVGIARASNTQTLFDAACDLGVRVIEDIDAQPTDLSTVLAEVVDFVAGVDVVHLSIDLDVLPAAVAPGVSAPAAYGVPIQTLDAICRSVAASGKLVVADTVELNPTYDIDSRTAKAAARLIYTITEHWSVTR